MNVIFLTVNNMNDAADTENIPLMTDIAAAQCFGNRLPNCRPAIRIVFPAMEIKMAPPHR